MIHKKKESEEMLLIEIRRKKRERERETNSVYREGGELYKRYYLVSHLVHINSP